jgi:2-oxoglutarate ferredoxin oxidoreductase subunit beta
LHLGKTGRACQAFGKFAVQSEATAQTQRRFDRGACAQGRDDLSSAFRTAQLGLKHRQRPCIENFGAQALGSRDPLVGMDWIYDHTKGKTKDGKDTDFVWETGIKHDASNSRPEYSKMLRDMNARVRSDMAASS